MWSLGTFFILFFVFWTDKSSIHPVLPLTDPISQWDKSSKLYLILLSPVLLVQQKRYYAPYLPSVLFLRSACPLRILSDASWGFSDHFFFSWIGESLLCTKKSDALSKHMEEADEVTPLVAVILYYGIIEYPSQSNYTTPSVLGMGV